MEQELKQRLIGAVVVTALAAIFIPMLFDDPVDNSGQVVSELIIPEAPIVTDTDDRLPADADQVLNAMEEPLGAENDAYPDRALDESEFAQSEWGQEGAGYAESMEAEDLQADEIIQEYEPVVEELKDAQAAPVMPEKVHREVTAKKPVKEIPKATTKPIPEEPPVAAKKPAEQQKAAPAKSGSGLTRWYIRAGSFSQEENATSLWSELRKQGFPASLETVQVNGKTLYRLKVGPELDHKRAIAMQEKVNKQNKIKSLLVSE